MPSEPSASEEAGQRGVRQPDGKDNAEDEVEDLSKLPTHVESVRDGLLDFYHFLGLQAVMLALEGEDAGEINEDAIPLSAYKPDGVTELQRAREMLFMKSAQVLLKGARSAEYREEWQILIRTVVTERVDSAHNSRYVDQMGTLDFC